MRSSPYTHLVVIIREGVPEVVGFHSEQAAHEYADYHGAQWSETYVTSVLKGPLV